MTKADSADAISVPAAAGDRFARLVDIMRTLRSPRGCAWDREQTVASLRPFVLEEAYEVVEAMDRGDRAALCEELGDLLLEAVFVAQICAEDGDFTIADAAEAVTAKLVRRHPHVFGGGADAAGGGTGTGDLSPAEVKRQWERIKRERARRRPRPRRPRRSPRRHPRGAAGPAAGVPPRGPRRQRRIRLGPGRTGRRQGGRRARRAARGARRGRPRAHRGRAGRPPIHGRQRRPQAAGRSRVGPAGRQRQVHPPLPRGRAAPERPRPHAARRLARRARTRVAGGQGRRRRGPRVRGGLTARPADRRSAIDYQ